MQLLIRERGCVMLGLIWFLFFQGFGLFFSRRLSLSRDPLERLLMGSVLGSVAAMWFPIPFSFFFGFSLFSHLCAAALSLLIAALLLTKKKRPDRCEERMDAWKNHRAFWFFLIPFMTLCVILLLSHTLYERNGALYTGQCTWGDMPMHLGFVTSIAVQGGFPPEYSILPGERLCYPFLCDSVSSSLYLLGTPLRWAYMIPAFFALTQLFGAFYLFSRIMLKKTSPALLACLFFFLNGGLGMIYYFRKYSLDELFTGFYKTPTNLTSEGIRWVNVIADMILPQRATLFGWALLFPILLLLYRAVFRGEEKLFLPAGVLGGLLPMIHTHSYLSLGLIAACWMISAAFRERLSRKWLLSWIRFGLPAVFLALPQLLLWTFHSVGGNEQFLRIHLDWVNGLQENWLWFWLKNVGVLFLLAPLSVFFAGKELRSAVFPGILIFLVCEIFVFQPNVYDNNKLLYIAYALLSIASADAVHRALEHVQKKPLRVIALSLLIALCANAAVFTLAREVVSASGRHAILLFSASDEKAAEYIGENTEKDSLFLTASNHNNAVAALTGRKILCGSSSYLFYHGLDYASRAELAQTLLTDEKMFEMLHGELGIDYVYIGNYERSIPGCNEKFFSEHYPLFFSDGSVRIYLIGGS